MLDRRSFIGAAALGATLPALPAPALAQPPEAGLADAFGFVGPQDDPVFGARIRGGPAIPTTVGTDPSRHDEVRMAFRLLFDLPRGNDHLAVARYFAGITARNAEGRKYNEEWPGRANPLIVGLFSMTNTLPSEGDQTKWCAAFVSFCLYAAGKQNKFSALSGAYRTYGTATSSPVPGDVVVFSALGEAGRNGQGHVGFFVGRTGSSVRLLGGNQRGNTGSTGAVTEADYAVSGAELQLHSFRRVT
jgi:uncharacterized protein (TIGR02594 family)